MPASRRRTAWTRLTMLARQITVAGSPGKAAGAGPLEDHADAEFERALHHQRAEGEGRRPRAQSPRQRVQDGRRFLAAFTSDMRVPPGHRTGSGAREASDASRSCSPPAAGRSVLT